jgi:hypothetical protein
MLTQIGEIKRQKLIVSVQFSWVTWGANSSDIWKSFPYITLIAYKFSTYFDIKISNMEN